jgi:hypothetical protein
MSKTDALAQLEKFFYQGLEEESIAIIFMINNSVFTTMLSIAGTKVKTVEYCSG